MKMKKTLCTLLAVMSLCTAALAGCGGSEESSAANSTAETTSAAEENTTVDVTAVADKLKNEITYDDEIIELDSAKIEKIVGVSADLYTTAKVYVGSSGATPEEIDCFEAKDEASAAEIKTALENRVESQKAVFENYKPEQMPKLEEPVIVVNGNYVYMCVSGDNDKAKEIIG